MKKKDILICPAAISIFYIKDKEKKQREWDKLVKVPMEENEAIKQFEKIGFWNMSCVRISEAQQLRKIK